MTSDMEYEPLDDDDPDICEYCGQGPEDCHCHDGDDCGRLDQNAPFGMLPVGMCHKAGTEECDFECPYRDGSEP